MMTSFALTMIVLSVPLIFLWLTDQQERYNLYNEIFLFSGANFIYRKFIPTEKEPVPTGFVWIVGIYFAFYAFTSQRYENKIDSIEFRYNTFILELVAGVPFNFERFNFIVGEKIPFEPHITSGISITKSFLFPYSNSVYYLTQNHKNLKDYQQTFITQWKENLEKSNFQKAALKHSNFVHANLKGANFRRANLQKSAFADADLEGATFHGANLEGAKFNLANLKGVNFGHANLKNSNLSSAILKDADFSFAKMKGAKDLIFT